MSGHPISGNRLKRELLNLPNLLTYSRVMMIPVILWLIDHESALNGFSAAVLFTLASLTDVLDGWLARTYGQVSMVGKFLDPLADKLIVLSVLVYLVAIGRFPDWLLTIILMRELAITGLRTVAVGEGMVISASDSAKHKTAFQLVGIIGLLIHYQYEVDFLFAKTWVNFHDVGMVMIGLSVFFSLYSAAHYFGGFYRAMIARKV